MSVQAIQAFAVKVQQDESFRKQVQAVMVAGQQPGAAELLKVATGAGFQFTEAELTAAVQEQMTQRHAAGELKDEDLLQVTGGTLLSLTLIIGPVISAGVLLATLQAC